MGYKADKMPTETTQGISVRVESRFLDEHSSAHEGRYVFTYFITIENVGDAPAQLTARHWIITNAQGETEEVEGPGVVGETPHLAPGQEHSYQSFCVLTTPRGTMHGTYKMQRDDGSEFQAEIPVFVLATPGKASQQVLN